MSKILNKIKVKPIPIKGGGVVKDFKGKALFEEQYPNILILSKKKKGKTTVIYNILKNIASKKTTVIIFSSTVYRDANMRAIIEKLEEKCIPVIAQPSIFEDGVNQVSDLTEYLGQQEKQDSKDEYILVFDDLSKQISDASIAYLLKRNRHFRCKVIISTQYYHDVDKEGRHMFDYLLLLPKIHPDKINLIHDEADLSIDKAEFQKLYKMATQEKYNFLYVDIQNEKFRKNFNEELKTSENNL